MKVGDIISEMKMSEHDLVCLFRDLADRERWEFYPENQAWDFLMQDKLTGTQIGFQAKLKINSNVVEQCLSLLSKGTIQGPNFGAVLIPFSETQIKSFDKFKKRCLAKKLLIFTERDSLQLLSPNWEWARFRFKEPVWIPPFVPDLPAGVKSPRSVTPFKVGVVLLCAAMRAGLQPTQKQIKEYRAGSIYSYWDKYLKKLPGRPARYAIIDESKLPDLHEFKDVAIAMQAIKNSSSDR